MSPLRDFRNANLHDAFQQHHPALHPVRHFFLFGDIGAVLKVHESRIRGFLPHRAEGHLNFSSVVDHAR